jgi:hypothetical protein
MRFFRVFHVSVKDVQLGLDLFLVRAIRLHEVVDLVGLHCQE